MNVDRVLRIIGAIGVIGAIIAGFLGELVASIIMGGLVLLVGIGYSVTLRKKNLRPKTIIDRSLDQPELLKFYDNSIWISATKKNKQVIDAQFIKWDECTLLLWVYVPPKGEGFRDAPHNRYLLAHHTGDAESLENFNAFALRYSKSNTWDFSISNSKPKYLPTPIKMEDGLEPGWHHFMISWDRLRPELNIYIDLGKCGNYRSTTFLSFWPEKISENVTIGAWVSGYDSSYCETKLHSLWICKKYLTPENEIVRQHHTLIHG